MREKTKKTLVLIVCLLFLSITFTDTYFSKSLKIKNENEETIDKKTLNLYRHGINGEITQVETEIELKENEDIDEAILEKCRELFKKDNEFQKYIKNLKIQANNSNLTYGAGLFSIRSSGKGFHFKTKWLLRIAIKYLMFKFKLPALGIPGRKSILFCSYKNDPDAQTKISPMLSLSGIQNSTEINGEHSIFVANFRGFTTWPGRSTNFFSLFRNSKPLLKRSFFGFTPLFMKF